jgi:L-threonylcarbamoyladenylate synthase
LTVDNRSVKTLRLLVDPARIETTESEPAVAQAAKIIGRGGLVAFPTETVYGLGANALEPRAVARIFAAKQRPAWDPIIVHIAGPVDSNPMIGTLVAEVPEPARQLMSAFWPGPLTLLLRRSTSVPDVVTAGRPLVGVRMPTHPIAVALIRKAGVPVAAPSANIFGHISPTTADHVLDDLDGRIDAVLDAGPTEHGVESTVLDPNQSPMMIYRPGAITAKQIELVAGPVQHYGPDSVPGVTDTSVDREETLPSPGVGIRHYAPRAKIILIDAPLETLPERIAAEVRCCGEVRIGVLLPADVAASEIGRLSETVVIYPWGSWAAPEELAHSLYAGLRALDARRCSVIICPLPPAEGIGLAIRDRLGKASR